MAAYRRVYDSRHLQADCQEPRSGSGALRSVIDYGLPFYMLLCGAYVQLEVAQGTQTAAEPKAKKVKQQNSK